jgi:hypothetical protein
MPTESINELRSLPMHSRNEVIDIKIGSKLAGDPMMGLLIDIKGFDKPAFIEMDEEESRELIGLLIKNLETTFGCEF